jgi:hypothetical protein
MDPSETLKKNAEQTLENVQSVEVDDETHITICLSKPYPRSEIDLRNELTNGNSTTVSITDKYKENGNYCFQVYFTEQ